MARPHRGSPGDLLNDLSIQIGQSMRYFYDTEFIENGKMIDLISIGIVCQDGREYYGVSTDFNRKALAEHSWLVANVLPSLPYVRVAGCAEVLMDVDHPDRKAVKPSWQIAQDVREFISEGDEQIELWAYYSAYDHVALMRLWGPMIAKPDHLPMWTHDIMQLTEMIAANGGRVTLPEQASGHHNALADARHVAVMWGALNGAGVTW